MHRTSRPFPSPIAAGLYASRIFISLNRLIAFRSALQQEVFEAMVDSGKAPDAIVEERGMKQITDTGAIDAAVDKILSENADKVSQYKAGKTQVWGWFVGQVMKATQGKANPAMCSDALKKKLDA